jgi:uncharacterized protein (TIGR02284 family)
MHYLGVPTLSEQGARKMMNAGTEKVVTVLNQLIVTCKDGLDGFHSAGENLKSTDLKKLFLTYEQQRRDLLSELQPEVRKLGGDPEDSGTVSAAMHRGWMNLKQLLGSSNETALIDEAERSEDIAVENYQAALKEDLPVAVRSIVLRQYNEIKLAHDRISELKKAQPRPSA